MSSLHSALQFTVSTQRSHRTKRLACAHSAKPLLMLF